MGSSFKLSISENYLSACASEALEGKSMRLHDFLGRAGPEGLNGNTKSVQRGLKERTCGIRRSAEP